MQFDPQHLNFGIVSMTFCRLIAGNRRGSAAKDNEVARTLGELAIDQRTGRVDHSEPIAATEATARGLLTDQDGRLAFSNAQVCELAEAWAVAEHLQPDYVDRAGMYDRAVRHLSSIGAGAVPLLVELLGNDETSVAKGAAFALGGIGNEAIGGLRWAILFGNARVRTYALQGLSAMKAMVPLTDDLLNLVATVLAEDGHAMVKNEAVGVLADTNHPVAVKALERALSEESVTRMLAQSALKRLGTPEATRALDDAKRTTTPRDTPAPQGTWHITAPRPQPAAKRTARIFISYAREDAAKMEGYRRRFELSGFEVWADSERLIVGDRWEERLRFAIGSSDFVVALLSASTWDGYQQVEITQAIAEQAKRQAPFFLPVFLSQLEWLTGSERWPAGLSDSHVIVGENFATGWTQLYSSISEAARMLGLEVPARLRSEPRNDLAERDIWRMVFDKDFFSLERNPDGKPLGSEDEWDMVWNGAFAHDRATGLTWTRSPVVHCNRKEASWVPKMFRSQLLARSIGSPRGLRLPTLEEASSLVTLATTDDGLHRVRHVTGEQYMLTCDTMSAPAGSEVTMLVWVMDFRSTDVAAVPIESKWPVWLVTSE
jgi:hypothetical protein